MVFNFAGKDEKLAGKPVEVGQAASDFTALKRDLTEYEFFKETEGKVVLISSTPSLDTGVCEFQAIRFNEEVSNLSEDVAIVTISCDLPFAQKRFCGANGIDRIEVVSDHRNLSFGNAYGFVIENVRLLARGVVVIDKERVVRYVEYVPAASQHPDYDKAIEAVKALV
ncbi:thiol peroxidase [Acidaminobacter hydrogenoformans]|uniref:Thiol peroxidase (Atypical 2-Cys peroxiredoxin) n=1 Tax=Acidaminobacter hydrogenoformans DSM 2784 TaxID=1120920 RepID=A0A1G5RSJ5_9FIRM|nr:thiol peroxidase [Acidaminobacter hydrogenoformans]SCZ77063.1 thiol peroxidase (atypical 2-Cys peroxiredoxin) [Acidaminobacter hydrogenoformans DSM 2784]